jgi:hypothetical protein
VPTRCADARFFQSQGQCWFFELCHCACACAAPGGECLNVQGWAPDCFRPQRRAALADARGKLFSVRDRKVKLSNQYLGAVHVHAGRSTDCTVRHNSQHPGYTKTLLDSCSISWHSLMACVLLVTVMQLSAASSCCRSVLWCMCACLCASDCCLHTMQGERFCIHYESLAGISSHLNPRHVAVLMACLFMYRFGNRWCHT